MRLSSVLSLFLAMLGSAIAAEPTFPLWDGSESVADYAKRVNMPPTKTLDLGNGVKMELVLIPAGKFIMGTPRPVPVDEEEFRKKIVIGQTALAAGVSLLLALLGTVIVLAIRKRKRPKFSLARLLAITATASVAVLGGLHWRQSVWGLDKARTQYVTTKARYDFAAYFETSTYQIAEKPAHPVTLTLPYYMGTCEVTQEQWQQVIGSNPSQFKGKDNPVESVSWDDAQDFCKKVMEQTKETVRLPTEAEWEHACRAGTTTTYYSGDTPADLARVAWYSANSNGITHPVGQKGANIFGLYDMHGNVWQWCQDWWGESYYAQSPAEDPGGPAHGGCRVLRGGSWDYVPLHCRSADRHRRNPDDRDNRYGFRVVVPTSGTQSPNLGN